MLSLCRELALIYRSHKKIRQCLKIIQEFQGPVGTHEILQLQEKYPKGVYTELSDRLLSAYEDLGGILFENDLELARLAGPTKPDTDRT